MSSPVDHAQSTAEFALTEAELAWAKEDLRRTLDKLKLATKEMRRFYETSRIIYREGRLPVFNLLAAEDQLAETELALIRLKNVVAREEPHLLAGKANTDRESILCRNERKTQTLGRGLRGLSTFIAGGQSSPKARRIGHNSPTKRCHKQREQ